MFVAILLALVATTESIDTFDRSYEASGVIDFLEERSFLEQRSAIELKITISDERPFNATITNGEQSAQIYTNHLELSYIPETIYLSDSVNYECTISASAGKPYLFLSLPALFCSLLGFALLFSYLAKRASD
jgi:hypothetical protein